jgi:DNA primase
MIPKYINSPGKTFFGYTLYNKSNLVYGLSEGSKLIRKFGYAFVVEGYTDVLALQQNSLPGVAGAGTSFTEGQAKEIKRFTNKTINMFDADTGGIRAITKIIGIQYKNGLSPKVIFLPEGEDPGSYFTKQKDPVGAFYDLEVYDALEAFIIAEKKLLGKEKLDFDEKWDLIDKSFNEYFKWGEDKAKVLYGITEFSKLLDIEPIIAIKKYSAKLESERKTPSKELFNPYMQHSVATQFICNLLAYAVNDTEKGYAKTFLDEVPKDKSIFKSYQLNLLNIMEKELFSDISDTYTVLPIDLEQHIQTDIFKDSVSPLQLILNWQKENKISIHPAAEINLLKGGFKRNIAALSKLLHFNYRNAYLDAQHIELHHALAEGNLPLVESITSEIENIYYSG